jgi:hypothetical protein
MPRPERQKSLQREAERFSGLHHAGRLGNSSFKKLKNPLSESVKRLRKKVSVNPI